MSAALRLIENSFPSQDLFNRLSQDQVEQPQNVDYADLRSIAVELWTAHSQDRHDVDTFVNVMSVIEPFDQVMNAATLLREVAEQQ